MKTISKELAKKVMANGWYDTKNYRYVSFEELCTAKIKVRNLPRGEDTILYEQLEREGRI